ncbi:MAG: leucyl aminopeptidase [Rhodobacteraceae bacterium]|nr:MAG: leucyl aminopeptidase [Paracoccaceae bacterium]
MTSPVEIACLALDEAPLDAAEGAAVVFVRPDGSLGPAASAADEATGGAVSRLVASKGFRNKPGDAAVLAFPSGLKADRLVVAALGETAADARRAGGAAAGKLASAVATVYGDGAAEIQAEIAFGAALRLYDFDAYKKRDEETADDKPRRLRFATETPEAVAKLSKPHAALAEGVFFTRDLVNEPANVLTTDDFAARLGAMGELGLDVEILGEDELAKLGMRCLLAVGQGSASESKVVVMKWMGGRPGDAPLALIGKGVVFDTGGISIKPAAGMEEMTMDMGGAGVVAGVMRTLALRKAQANVVGVVGLVENMPSDRAQRPGDIVKSMKGDTVEVINTDAEGRLVLADVLWYVQETFKPAAMVDLATLTGAMIIALGHHTAGYFATDDGFAAQFEKACKDAGEAAWRLPLGPEYDKALKSRLADMKNTGGRPAGSITAAQFLKRFVKDGTPWIHIDIAGVALMKEGSDLAPGGATGWGVRALDRLVRDYER